MVDVLRLCDGLGGWGKDQRKERVDVKKERIEATLSEGEQ